MIAMLVDSYVCSFLTKLAHVDQHDMEATCTCTTGTVLPVLLGWATLVTCTWGRRERASTGRESDGGNGGGAAGGATERGGHNGGGGSEEGRGEEGGGRRERKRAGGGGRRDGEEEWRRGTRGTAAERDGESERATCGYTAGTEGRATMRAKRRRRGEPGGWAGRGAQGAEEARRGANARTAAGRESERSEGRRQHRTYHSGRTEQTLAAAIYRKVQIWEGGSEW